MTPCCVISSLTFKTIQSSPPVRCSTCVSEWIINLIDGKRILLFL